MAFRGNRGPRLRSRTHNTTGAGAPRLASTGELVTTLQRLARSGADQGEVLATLRNIAGAHGFSLRNDEVAVSVVEAEAINQEHVESFRQAEVAQKFPISGNVDEVLGPAPADAVKDIPPTTPELRAPQANNSEQAARKRRKGGHAWRERKPGGHRWSKVAF